MLKQLHITESVLKTKGWTSWDWDMKNAELRSWNWTNCIFFQLSNPNHPFKLLIGMSGRVLDHMFFFVKPRFNRNLKSMVPSFPASKQLFAKTREFREFCWNCLGCSLVTRSDPLGNGRNCMLNRHYFTCFFGSQDDTHCGCITGCIM